MMIIKYKNQYDDNNDKIDEKQEKAIAFYFYIFFKITHLNS